MQESAAIRRITRWRVLGAVVAAAIVAIGATLSSGVAQGRVDPSSAGATRTQISPDTDGRVTGGGTVVVQVNVVASFGINGKRPTGFTGGAAVGRINYDKHAPGTGRHVNVPVVFMSVELSATPSTNGTGGKAQLVGDCNAPGSECPAGFQSVLVYVEDNSDTGGGDKFEISYCPGQASVSSPGCVGLEGGTIRTGNIQIRPSGGTGSSGSVPTAFRAPIRLP
jgi:hypothetical protein